MPKRKFILLSILKTWLLATLVSEVLLIGFMEATKRPEDHHRMCDMSGLGYVLIAFWILVLSAVSFSSLLSLLKPFQGTIRTALCWFLLPAIPLIYALFLTASENFDPQGTFLLLIFDLPWLMIWTFYYIRFRSRFK
ncbi:MAG: hypothetical protein LBE92_22045 [Chryseobacterium sp.]|jgi:uncharacterized membrane protein|uniref:hypothetical protein n=1 Tax=Chryseobacterium sp. TaxID=1871047 RepID=UPI002833D3A8|nr:hypothetical protein [Chryseobacterium sp.]MDR2238806.1 hypothetical protein [Chryseobacterium sp.]